MECSMLSDNEGDEDGMDISISNDSEDHEYEMNSPISECSENIEASEDEKDRPMSDCSEIVENLDHSDEVLDEDDDDFDEDGEDSNESDEDSEDSNDSDEDLDEDEMRVLLDLLLDNTALKAFLLCRKRSLHAKEMNMLRLKYGQYHTLFLILRRHPEEFRMYMRMSIDTFDYILEAVAPTTSPKQLFRPMLRVMQNYFPFFSMKFFKITLNHFVLKQSTFSLNHEILV
ncbi:hypothetical protein QAD02_020120 [Eretmocerus hayati]|uniref:Uncharacterized protein n=1 Tax=Eretmocerus hayati TaxID=131215 RepID=A0ACC2PMR3_9HYME|nr:hypothetical protein QAD02_020120 [Eretmocerus hayati]